MTDSCAERIAAARSWLFTPGTRPELFRRAGEAGADAIILDLEDAVAPADKDAARGNVIGWLAASAPDGPLRAVRINAPSTRAGLRDLDALLGAAGAPQALFVPKCEGPGTVALVTALFAEAGSPVPVIAMVESAAGVAGLADLARAPGLGGIALGTADLSADLGCDPDGAAIEVIRTSVVVQATATGLPAIDAPCFALDGQRTADEARAAARLGFRAKAAIHPGQIAAVNAAFAPSPADVAWAERVIAAAAAGAAAVDGAMVDEAVARRARHIVSRTAPPGP